VVDVVAKNDIPEITEDIHVEEEKKHDHDPEKIKVQMKVKLKRELLNE